jgi:hypothetical protein
MLIGQPADGSRQVSLSYVLSYTLQEEPVTDMGKDIQLTLPPL